MASDTTATHPNWFSALTQHEISEFHLLSADLLLVETSINDGPVCFGQGCWEALWPETQKVAHAHTELLIRLVRALPHPPSIMYVGLRWKGAYWVEAANKTLLPVWRGESYPRKCDGVYAQLAVTHPLGVAHVSPWDGLLAAAPPPDDEWFASTYAIKGDLAHSASHRARAPRGRAHSPALAPLTQ